MKFIEEPARKTPVIGEFDLVVVGGSCTGVFAAVRAARLGLKVAIVEQHNCFGGVATAGNVSIWHSLFDTKHRQRIIGGLTAETIERLRKRGAVKELNSATSAFKLNTEELKIELDGLILEHDIAPFLHTFYVDAVSEDDEVCAVVVENKNGRSALCARQFIDATGDGALALDLGLPSFRDGAFQPPTACAKIIGFECLADFDWIETLREHGPEFGLAEDWGWGTDIPGLPGIQMRADSHVFGIDGADADDLTRAEIESRRQVRALLDLIRKYGPAEADLALVDLPSTIGIRETARIEAGYRLTGDDVLYGRRFEDAICNGSYRVDIHHDDGPGITFRYLDGTESVVPARGLPARKGRWRDPLPEDPVFYQIPLGCLRPRRFGNLMLAGRMLDADKVAFSAARVMVNMNQTGEAAGVASALAAIDRCDVRELETDKVRRVLAEGGSVIL